MAKKKTSPTRVRMVQIPKGNIKYAGAIFRGECPNKGSTLLIDPGNGVSYEGEVTEATDADGEVLVEFQNGLKAV